MLQVERGRGSDGARVGAEAGIHDQARWHIVWKVEKFDAPNPGDEQRVRAGLIEPYAVEHIQGNLFVLGGVSTIWQTLMGNGTASAGSALAYFNNANTYIGVGSVTTAAADTQTRLLDASPAYGTMEATYPLHTDGTTTATSGTIAFRSVFGTAVANKSWQEFTISNGTATASRILNRKVQDLGTKTSAHVWTVTASAWIA